MRDVYYQSAGNPVQEHRLPTTRPEIEFSPPRRSWGETLPILGWALALMAAASTITLFLYRAGGIAWLEPFDLLFCWPTLLGGLVFAIYAKRIAVLLHPVVLAAFLLACMNHQTPMLLQTGMISAFSGMLAYVFGRHWTVIATASPMPREAAAAFRSRSQLQLLVIALLQAGLVAWLLLSRSIFPRIALTMLPLAALAMPPPARLVTSRYKLLGESLLSWFTHEARSLPGLVQTPIGPMHHRIGLMVVACVLTAVGFIRHASEPNQEVFALWVASPSSEPLHPGYGLLLGILTAAWIVGAPILAALTLSVSAPMPVLLEAGAERDAHSAQGGGVEAVLDNIRTSPDRTERASLFQGQVVEDGSPVLIPRLIYTEHAHGLGDSGVGKTSLFLCPTIEQLASFGDCSLIVLDLKADSLELLASLQAAADAARRRFGLPMPLKFFSNQRTNTTFAFNPMQQPFWPNFDLLTRTDILCAANGLSYGTDYGAGYYSSANAAILYHTLKTYPHVATFSELADCIGTVITVANKRELHPEIRKAGVHVHEVIKRLAACEALNVTGSSGHAPAAVEQAIDLTQLFREPQFLYCHLPSSLSPSGAPEIARLFTYMLLAASTQTERRCQVFLVIDEFQRMVANNLEYMLQLARSMGVGVIIANQTMQDLKKGNIDLIPAIEANCRLRQWFSVSSGEDQERLMRSSGVTIDTAISRSTSVKDDGKRSTSYTETEQVVPRLSINDILLTNDHPFRSILRVSRGDGYAQFGGMPVIIESQYHITRQEYQRRKALPWPAAEGAFQPRAEAIAGERATGIRPQSKSGIQWSEEVIGGPPNPPLSPAGEQDIKTLFDSLRTDIEAPAPRRRKGNKP